MAKDSAAIWFNRSHHVSLHVSLQDSIDKVRHLEYGALALLKLCWILTSSLFLPTPRRIQLQNWFAQL